MAAVPGRLPALLVAVWVAVSLFPAGLAADPFPPEAPGVRACRGDVQACREAAVLQARAGEVTGARAALEALHRSHPNDRRVRLDLAVVAAWDGDDGRALALLEPLAPATLPDYVLEAYARAARNLGRWDQALTLYDLAAARPGAAPELELGRALVLADAGRFADAREELGRVRHRRLDDPRLAAEAAMAAGYVEERAGHLTRALAHYRQALDASPDHREARRRLVLAAAALGASERALALAEGEPDLLSAAELARLQLDVAARAVRRAALPGSENDAAAALAMHHRLEEAAGASLVKAQRAALELDRIAALAADGRSAEAVAAFEALVAEQRAADPGRPATAAMPAYVLAAAGRAHLALRQPARAAALFEAALARNPDDFELQLELFIAYSDSQDHDRAGALATRMLAEQPAWADREPGRWRPNPDYARAREAAALELAYRDRYGEALEHLDALLALAPANSTLRLARARVLWWRGWPEDAAREVDRVLAVEPGNLQARRLSGTLALERRRFEEAARALAEVAARAPEDDATRALAARWYLHGRPELVIEAAAGRSDGSAFSSRDWSIDARYFTAPIADSYRAFIHDRARYGRFDEGVGRDHRLGAGIERRLPRWRWQAEVHGGLEDNGGAGAEVSVARFVGDRLSVEAGVGINDPQVPLRAARIGVQGDRMDLGGRWRWNEALEAGAGVGLMDMDDGNTRRWLQSDASLRLANLPRHKLTVTARAFASRNDETARVYYNPESDRELAVGLAHDWRLLRRYDRGLTQRLGVEIGHYHQRGFGSGPVWTLFAEHRWQLGPRAALRYGVRTGGRRYDGEREHAAAAFAALEWRP